MVYRWRMTTLISHRRHDVKGQGLKVTWSVWAVLAQWPINRKRIVVASPKFALGTRYQDSYDRQSRWSTCQVLDQGHKLTSHSVRLISASSYFGKQNVVPVSLEADGGIYRVGRIWRPHFLLKLSLCHFLSNIMMIYLCGEHLYKKVKQYMIIVGNIVREMFRMMQLWWMSRCIVS